MYNKSELMGKTQEELVQMYLDMQFCNVNLVADNQRKDERIANLEEIVRLRNAQKFAPSSEQTGYLFDELELLANLEDQKDGLPLEEQTVTVSEHERKQSRPRVNTTLPADTPVIDVNVYDEAPETKVVDGVVYRRTSDKVIDKIYLVPQKYIVVREHFLRYEPSETADPDDKPIVVFREPKLDGMAATPNFIAKAVVAKYDDYQPLYRQEEMHGRAGLKVSRQKLAGWIIQYYEALLPLERVLKKHVYSSAMLYKDETRTTVLSVKSSGGRISRNGYMYITLGTTFVEKGSNFHTLVLCEYIQGRSRDVLLEDLKKYDYSGPVITDGLKQYLHIENHGACWVHMIRNFKNVIKACGEKKDANAVALVKIYKDISNAHYDLMEKLKAGEVSKDEFLSQRREKTEPLIKEFYDKIEDIESKYPSSGVMGKAISYAKEYKPYLSLYPDYVEGEPSTNCVERVAKCWATGRGNWLFSESVDGADASSFFMSLIETAKRSGVQTDDYIEYVLTFAPYGSEDDSEWEKMLPWNIDMERLNRRRAEILGAKPDPSRTAPYVFCGNSR